MKRNTVSRILFIVLLTLGCSAAEVCAQGLAGTEFWFGLPQNFRQSTQGRQSNHEIILSIAGTVDANVSVTVAGEPLPNIQLPANSVQHIQIPETAVSYVADEVTHRSVHVVSDQPVVLSLLDSRFQTTESMSILPVEFYGTDYVLTSYTPLAVDLVPSAVFVAMEDGTKVELTSNNNVRWSSSYELNAGQAVRIDGRHVSSPTDSSRPEPGEIDLTGFRLTSNKRISVVTGHKCAYVPAKTEACNFLIEHLPPTNMFGTRYVIPMIPGRKFEQMRVVPLHADTRFKVAGLTYSVSKGAYKEITMEGGPFELTADHAVMIVLYTPGYKSGDSIGDPSMLLVPPVDAWEKTCVFSVPNTKTWMPTVSVVGSPELVSTLVINSKELPEITDVHATDGFIQLDMPMRGEFMTLSAPYPMMVIVSSQTRNFEAYDGFSTFSTWGR